MELWSSGMPLQVSPVAQNLWSLCDFRSRWLEMYRRPIDLQKKTLSHYWNIIINGQRFFRKDLLKTFSELCHLIVGSDVFCLSNNSHSPVVFGVFFIPVMLQVLYKLKTAKVFDRNRSKEDKGSADASDEDPFAIQIMAWCPESRMLCVAGVSANVIIYRFSKLEVTTEVLQVSHTDIKLL